MILLIHRLQSLKNVLLKNQNVSLMRIKKVLKKQRNRWRKSAMLILDSILIMDLKNQMPLIRQSPSSKRSMVMMCLSFKKAWKVLEILKSSLQQTLPLLKMHWMILWTRSDLFRNNTARVMCWQVCQTMLLVVWKKPMIFCLNIRTYTIRRNKLSYFPINNNILGRLR